MRCVNTDGTTRANNNKQHSIILIFDNYNIKKVISVKAGTFPLASVSLWTVKMK